MQGFIHLVLLALLFITSVTGQRTSSPTTISLGSPAVRITTLNARTPTTQNTGDSTTTTAQGSTTTGAVVSTPTGLSYRCQNNNCTGGSSCVGLNTTFFCMCREGYYYDQTKCQEGKVFPGTLTKKASDISDLEDKRSMAYQELHFDITNFFKGVFNDPDYGQTVIKKVSPSDSPRSGLRNGEKIYVTVVHILNKDTILTEQKVTEKVNTALLGDDRFSDYNRQQRPCENNACTGGSTCVNLNYTFVCLCPEGQYHKGGKCHEGRVFFGKITINASYIPELENRESLAYQELYWNMTQFFAGAFTNNDYGQTIIHKISPSLSVRRGMRATETIKVTIKNIVKKDTQLNEVEVYTKIEEKINNSNIFLSYTDQVYPCEYKYCSYDSSCINLNDTAICLCPEGYYYKEDKCNRGKLFPGKLELQTSYIPELENKTSLAYQNLYFNITQFLKGIFNDPDYGQTVIEKVSPSTSPRYGVQAAETVEVTVMNIFDKSTTLTVKDVNERINKSVNGSEIFTSYNEQDVCDYYGCVMNDNQCTDHLTCVCKSGMYRPNAQASQCVPDPCPQSCTSKSNTHCQWNATAGLAKCVCLPDYMEDGNGICQKCAFGYSGVNCQDNFQLILTIVGSIAGICILGLVIAVIFMGVRSRSRQENTDKQTLVEDDSQSMAMQNPGFPRPYRGGNLFPMAQPGPSNQLHNPYKRAFPTPSNQW